MSRPLSRIGTVLFPVIAVLIGVWLYRTGPVVEPAEEKRPPKMVRTLSVSPGNHPIRVIAHGSVIPARRLRIETEVSGKLIRLHPGLRPGGIIKAGDELFEMDPRLTELDLASAKAEVSQAEAALEEATRKWSEGRRLASQAVIPPTELASLESTVKMQSADLERLRVRQARQEELLSRHRVRAPFNAMVLEEFVELGQKLDPGDVAMTLIGTDEFWVRVSLPTDKLRWIAVPTSDQPGARAQVILDAGNDIATRYPGRVIQLLGDLGEEGRMARILIRVENPLKRGPDNSREPLLLDSYVRVEIEAGELENVLAIDRASLREGDRIWIVDRESRLQIRDVNVHWREGETVYINAALDEGEKLVVSDLRVALPDQVVTAQEVSPRAKE